MIYSQVYLVKTFTNTVIFEYNPTGFFSGDRLNPLPNPSSNPDGSGDKLLLLLLPLSNLLLNGL